MSDDLLQTLDTPEPRRLTHRDAVRVEWSYSRSDVTPLLLERFLVHDKHLDRCCPYSAGDRLQKRGLDSRMLDNDWVRRDGSVTERGASILNAAAGEGYWRVVSRAREQGARAAIEWLLEGGV